MDCPQCFIHWFNCFAFILCNYVEVRHFNNAFVFIAAYYSFWNHHRLMSRNLKTNRRVFKKRKRQKRPKENSSWFCLFRHCVNYHCDNNRFTSFVCNRNYSNTIYVIMKDKLFNRILLAIFIVGIISVVALFVVTLVLYQNTSMITFIEKEIW